MTAVYNILKRFLRKHALKFFFLSSYLIRIAAGHEAVACEWQSDGVQYPYTAASFLCGLVFFLLYFFGMAGTLW